MFLVIKIAHATYKATVFLIIATLRVYTCPSSERRISLTFQKVLVMSPTGPAILIMGVELGELGTP